MPIRLIEPSKEFSVEISGTKFYFRQLNARQRVQLTTAMRDVGLRPGMEPEDANSIIMSAIPNMEPILTKVITRTEDPELEPNSIFNLIADPLDYVLLAMKILDTSGLNEGEEKN